MTSKAAEVAIVGGGPAGAATAILLAGLGHEVVLLEGAPRWRWRACGVFAGPAAVEALRRIGMAEDELRPIAQPVAAMRVETVRGTTFRLSYDGSGALADSAVGFDREGLDEFLLGKAAAAGAQIARGARVTAVALERGGVRLRVGGVGGVGGVGSSGAAGAGKGDRGEEGPHRDVTAQIVVGADGLRSIVAAAAGVTRRAPFGNRAALTFHVRSGETSGEGDAAPDARMVVLRDGYVGIAPVPGGRSNIGIVLGPSWSAQLARDGAAGLAARVLTAALPEREHVAVPRVLDSIAGVRPVSAAVRRRAGNGWLLVGDAAGFLDPFTGEGIHRALVSAEAAATTLHEVLGHRSGASVADFDRAIRARFGSKDLVSRLVQAFLGRPTLFEYAARRLAARPAIRDTMGRVIGDLEPASGALDPRYLAALLAP